jgi:hypothetical protein
LDSMDWHSNALDQFSRLLGRPCGEQLIQTPSRKK